MNTTWFVCFLIKFVLFNLVNRLSQLVLLIINLIFCDFFVPIFASILYNYCCNFLLFLCIYHFILWIYFLQATLLTVPRLFPCTLHNFIKINWIMLLCRLCRLVIFIIPKLIVTSSQSLLFNYLNSCTSFKITILLHSVKLHSFSFQKSNTILYFAKN